MQALRNLKIWVRLVVGISAILVIAGSGLIAWTTLQQRDTAIQQAQDFSMSVHRMTMASLTGMMITGTIAQRAVYLDQVRQSEEIRGLQVIRSDAVVKQFGAGASGESESDAIERGVMETKQPHFEVIDDSGGESLRAIIPVIAQTNYLGKNCLTCHLVPEGTALGVVSMRISLDKLNQSMLAFRLKTMLAAFGLILPVIAFVYFSIKGSVTRPLGDVTVSLRDIAEGEGDLTRRLAVAGRDEIGDMALAFNVFMEKLQGIIGEVKSGAHEVQSAVDELAVMSQRVAANSQQASQDAYAMATQVEIMTYTLDGLANQAEEVQRTSAASNEHSAHGGEIIHAAGTEMGQITSAVNASSQIIQNLGQHSDQISQIVNVIKEIADQTNLLALNAAIEAARAGEQGRGFAVVADEVRKLAERTSNSTQEITAMIEKIQSGTRLAIQSMESGVARVGAGAALAEQAGVAINLIKDGVGQVVGAVDEISASLKAQALSNGENAHKVENIARLSEENSTAFHETAKTVQYIDELARNLGSLVGRFKT
ncbi:MAG: methyl-accepting chemotaxis protein [Rhodocyclaceae bacterium]|nr:methyl-accepting chemotaxis protein [Rhodocyclaceae bacterium]